MCVCVCACVCVGEDTRYKMVLLPFHVYNYTHIRHYTHRDMHSI